MPKPTQTLRRYAAGVATLLALITAAVVAVRHSPERDQTPTPPQVEVTVRPAQTPEKSPVQTFPNEVVLRPLPVSLTSPAHEWTEGDASDISVIERIAHNSDEAVRMLEENERIHRRQLVYRKETAAALVQRARATGETVRKLTLPGLDGRELEFEIQRADLALSGLSGSFAGRLAGQPDSMVILSFRGNREAFSVSAPQENLHLQADPREPGEIIVKAIDPATYIQGGCGNPDHHH